MPQAAAFTPPACAEGVQNEAGPTGQLLVLEQSWSWGWKEPQESAVGQGTGAGEVWSYFGIVVLMGGVLPPPPPRLDPAPAAPQPQLPSHPPQGRYQDPREWCTPTRTPPKLWPWWRLAPRRAASGAESCPGPVGSSTTRPRWLGVCVARRRVCTAHSLAVCLHGAKGAKPSAGGGGGALSACSTELAGPSLAPGREMRLCLHPSSPHVLQQPLARCSPRGCPPHAGMAAALTRSRPLS